MPRLRPMWAFGFGGKRGERAEIRRRGRAAGGGRALIRHHIGVDAAFRIGRLGDAAAVIAGDHDRVAVRIDAADHPTLAAAAPATSPRWRRPAGRRRGAVAGERGAMSEPCRDGRAFLHMFMKQAHHSGPRPVGICARCSGRRRPGWSRTRLACGCLSCMALRSWCCRRAHAKRCARCWRRTAAMCAVRCRWAWP